jgi:hypothetical protein
MKTEELDTRTTAAQRPVLYTGKKSGEHLLLTDQAEFAICGTKIDIAGAYGGNPGQCKCKKCLRTFWEKYSGFYTGAYDISLWRLAEYRKVFRYCEKKPFVEKIKFEDLRSGDLFYMEERDQLFIPNDNDDCFLLVAMETPQIVGVDEKFRPTNWCVRTLSLTEFWRTYKPAIDVGSWEQLFNPDNI